MIEFTLKELIKLADRKSSEFDHQGHLTILKFTCHWKVFPGTPDLDGGDGRQQVKDLQGFKTLEEALKNYILG